MTYLYILTAALVITQLGDWYTTRTALKSGKGSEANKLAAWGMRKLGVDGYLAWKFAIVSAVGYVIGSQSLYTLGALVTFYSVVVINNWRISHR